MRGMTIEKIRAFSIDLRSIRDVDAMWMFLNARINDGTITREQAQMIAEEARQEVERRHSA